MYTATAKARPAARPVGEVILTTRDDPRRLLDPLSYQVGRADRVTLSHTAIIPPPRSNRLEDVAGWMDDHDLRIISAAQIGLNHQHRVIIGVIQ